MAGIGFRLQALITKGSYLEAVTAYLAAVVISSGPWLTGVVALMALNNTTFTYLSAADHRLLTATMVSVFAVSLLVASGPQLSITRYLADCFYLDRSEDIAPTCTGVLLLCLPISLLMVPFLLFSPFTMLYRLLTATLLLILILTWLLMIFLSAAREYMRIFVIFLISYSFGMAASLALGYHYALAGSLAGFTMGQALCLSLLVVSIYREFPSARSVDLSYLRYIGKYWDITLVGLFYALSIWADSLIFWFSPKGVTVEGFYHLSPNHDSVKFMMYLSVIPAVAVFVVHLETNFYRHYRYYCHLLQHKGTLAHLTESKKGMIEAVRSGWVRLLKVQFFVSCFLCLIARNLASWIGLDPSYVMLLRIEMFAGIGQFSVFATLLLLLYIDQRRSALLLVVTDVLCISGVTLLSLFLGDLFFGPGYLLVSILCALGGWFLLNAQLNRLEFLTFMTQPMP